MNKHFYIWLLLILFDGVSFLSFGQNFQKVYPLNGHNSLFNSILVDNNEFWLSGTYRQSNSSPIKGLILQLDETGLELHKDTFGLANEVHLLGFSNSELFLRNDSSYISYYVSSNQTPLEKETILIYDRSNNTILYSIDTTISNSGIRCVKGSDSFYDTSTNTIVTNVTIEQYTNGTKVGDGIMISKFDDSLTNIWRNYLLNPTGRYYSPCGIFSTNEKIQSIYSDILMSANPNGRNCKIVFTELDSLGSVTRNRIFQPSTFTQGASGVELVNNNQNYLLTYSDSKYDLFGGQNTLLIRPVLALLDTALNIVWKDSITQYWWRAEDGIEFNGFSPKDYIFIDSNVIFAHSYPKEINFSDTISFLCLLIENRKLEDGTINWNRSFQFYDSANFNLGVPYYEMYDSEFTPWDSGFVFTGTSYNADSSSAGVPGQLGYVLKTNCLGHLGDPIAGASFTYNDSLGVHFESTSIQDGSVTWYFGDGSIENRGEYQDSVFHQYDSSGSQEVMLVAHGCLGVKDTLRFTIEIPEYIEPTDSTEGPEPPTVVYAKTLAIAPNPTIEGEPLSVYLGDLPNSGANLVFMDQNGKQIQKFYFPSGQSMYMLPLSLAAGVYELVLLSNGEILDKERLVVS